MSCHCIGTLINPKCPEHGSMQRLREENDRLSVEIRQYREALHKIRDEPGNARDCRYYAAQALSGQD